ncbi:MAG: hypothetical protein KAS23_16350 [Anaerohalosphaera sp.]|nr:hypothetical protein [Anaerohalosphaera sp.]
MPGILEKRKNMHRQLAENARTCDQLQQQIDSMQALANIGMLSAMIAHEMNNILTPLGSYAQLAMKYPDDTALAQKALEKAVTNSSRAGRIMTSILAMAKGGCKEKQNYLLREMVEEVFFCMARDFSKDGIDVILNITDDLEVCAEQVSFQQVLMNLIINARHAMLARGGVLTISATRSDDQIRIDVSDTGDGIETEILNQIFDPFFTTKGQGTGLGLAFCKRVTQSHDGFICVNSEKGAGTTFSVILPAKNSDQENTTD